MNARVAVAAALVCLAVVAAPAGAAPEPVPIRHDRAVTAIALAGPDVVALSSTLRRLRIVALPRTGGAARTLLSVSRAGLSFDPGNLAASPERVAAIVDLNRDRRGTDEHRVYSGPPSGPLQLVRRTPDPDGRAFTPTNLSVDGDRLLLVERKIVIGIGEDEDVEATSAGEVRIQLLDQAGWHPIPWASNTRVPVMIAGPYAAVEAYGPRRLELVDLATGVPVASATGEWRPSDLTPDGRLLAVDLGKSVATLTPGTAPAALGDARGLATVIDSGLPELRLAGTSILGFERNRNTLDLRTPDGARATLGPISLVQPALDADPSGVAWVANGCLRYASLTPTPIPAGAPNPCPSAELALYTIGPESRLDGNRIQVPARCVASETGRCRGRLLIRLDEDTPIVARGRFDLKVSRRFRDVTVRFDAATVRKFRRERFGSGLVYAEVQDGTVGAGGDGSAEIGVRIPRR
jgi:hypothetical protein